MNVRLISAALALGFGVCVFGACGDDETTGAGGAGGSTSSSSGSTGGAGATGGNPTTGGAGGEGGGGVDCEALCGELYDCGAEDDNCPGFSGDPAEKETFINGDPENPADGCVQGCKDTPALAAIFDPEDCAGSVGIISGANPDFKEVCDNGFSGGGGAGGGGGAN
ncbi:MAG: hypothetical protein WKG00_33825 [Polyangiaceae bacterium]